MDLKIPPGEQAPHHNDAGTAAGINIRPGSDDDGWIIPQPITLNDGTTVQLYKDGEALHAAYAALHQAKRRICLEVYIFASDDTGRTFADLLCKKAVEGLAVYVIYDSFGSIDTDRQMFRQMKRAGVHLQQFNPIRPWECRFSWRPVNRDHRKLLIIDDEIAGLGGLNVGHQYAGSWIVPPKDAEKCDFWRDNAIGLVGPSARLFFHSFARTWHYVTHGGRIRRAEYDHNMDALSRPPQNNELSILASVPTRNSPLRPLLQKL
jgi:phosphatidylserine/phosphatidylglycerophosphate/cardiolipin synthase-like enzyme